MSYYPQNIYNSEKQPKLTMWQDDYAAMHATAMIYDTAQRKQAWRLHLMAVNTNITEFIWPKSKNIAAHRTLCAGSKTFLNFFFKKKIYA